ncbi:YqgQ family protein [Paenisporosarcina indica]|uniref:YqgQ family protein n=1 Tax=Paenisporosarcina indica TaxID=650093 RepID=UPI00094FFDDF|nr:YqgQ family protein [Paenisporosarcina indica]
MKSIYDVMQYLKRFGTFIYTTDRQADLILMEDEIRVLYKSQMMDTSDYQMAILILRKEMARLKDSQ